MKEIADWLIGLEEIAGEVYGRASRQFQGDDKLSGFLSDLAEDEALHFHIYSSRNGFRIKSEIKLSE